MPLNLSKITEYQFFKWDNISIRRNTVKQQNNNIMIFRGNEFELYCKGGTNMRIEPGRAVSKYVANLSHKLEVL